MINLDTRLNSLAASLSYLRYTAEAKQINGIIKNSSYSIEEWVSVLTEAEAPIPPDVTEEAITYIIQGAANFYKASESLINLDPEDIKSAMEIAKSAPGISTSAGFNFSEIHKVATLSKSAQTEWVKSIMQGVKSKGGAGLKTIPYIGIIFSAMLAVKNLSYGLWAYSDLIKDCDEIGLTWIDTLYPDRISQKITEFQGDPGKLIIATKTSKSAKVFVDEGISLVANSLDAVKDLLFLFVNFLSFGGSGFLDFGSSAIIAVMEWKAEEATLGKYDGLISKVKEIAENKIQQLTPQSDESVDYSSLTLDELEQLISGI